MNLHKKELNISILRLIYLWKIVILCLLCLLCLLLQPLCYSQQIQVTEAQFAGPRENQSSRLASPNNNGIELTKVDLPAIGGSIEAPVAWVHTSQEVSGHEVGQTWGPDLRSSKRGARFSIAWEPYPTGFTQAPANKGSQLAAITLKNIILKKLEKYAETQRKEIQIKEEPTAIDNIGTGAWMTIKEISPSNNNDPKSEINRIYLLLGRSHFIIVSIVLPQNDNPSNSHTPNKSQSILKRMLESLEYLTPYRI
jgi:hypothetical protein